MQRSDRPLRAMWLINHTTARKFEIPMLKRVGVKEIFLPKKNPPDPAFRSASIDWTEDENLTIPTDDLAILNAADWYDDPGVDAWQIANEHFDLAFFIVLKAEFFKSMTRHFDGAKIWRTYGLAKPTSYHDILVWLARREGPLWPTKAGLNLWFGHAYSHLPDIEPAHIAERAVFLPAGLADTKIDDQWTGEDKRIFFVCPDLAFNDYYQEVYRRFKRTFDDLPYVVAGAQPVEVQDIRVLGYVPSDQHQRNMRSFALMYYHSSEPNHVHYHPFEAVRAGMPLVFMAGGLLDRLGGIGLPGRCNSQEQARRTVLRILAGDRRLIDDIRHSQGRLLDPLTPHRCEPSWRAGIEKILQTKERLGSIRPSVEKKKRIAVIMPVEYHGGSLRGAKLLAQAVEIASRQAGSPTEVVLGHLDDPTCYSQGDFADLPNSIELRPFRWRSMSQDDARKACIFFGKEGPLAAPTYIVPDDGMKQFMDCDLWIMISGRITSPLLPVRPYLVMVYDYLQRYVSLYDEDKNQRIVSCDRAAEAVLVTTEFTAKDARQYAGIPAVRVKKVPLLAPNFAVEDSPPGESQRTPAEYFIWTTNLAPHKNHANALKALRLYYEQYDGALECHVTGVDTSEMFRRDTPHLSALREIRRASRALQKKVILEGELLDRSYRRKLQNAAFLWHPAKIDNGTFSVIEAATLGVPSLSSDYPAMREIDHTFKLSLSWVDPDDPIDMAARLKKMEGGHKEARRNLPSADVFANRSVERLAGEYWNVIREFL
jgi:glycosyltransferase involved in cell wall biosynthesis